MNNRSPDQSKDEFNTDNLNSAGVVAADKSDFAKAIYYFNKAIALSPTDSMGYFNRATVEMQLGNFTLARLDFDKAFKFKIIISA